MKQHSEIHTISKQNKRFQKLLKEIHDCPKRIFIRGTLPPSDTLYLSVVGTRKITSYGHQTINALIPPIALSGVVIVSGLAFGVDKAAHVAAIKAGGKTVAILPGGVDHHSVAPKSHCGLADEITQNGCLISEHPQGTATHAGSFPIRNRLIAGMSRATLVIEGTCKSGTMVTASLALRENRDVLCVPGSIFSPQTAGPLSLLKQGAIPIRNVEDLFESIGISRQESDNKRHQQERTPILNVLDLGPHSIDDIASILNLPAKTIMQRISSLEIQGLVTSNDQYIYTKI